MCQYRRDPMANENRFLNQIDIPECAAYHNTLKEAINLAVASEQAGRV